MQRLSITIHKDTNRVATIMVKGIIDAYSYTQLEQTFNRLVDERIYKFVVDLAGVDYMSGTGASIFMKVLNLCQENDGNIVLVNPKPVVRDLFDLLGFTNILTVTGDIKSALKLFNHPQGQEHQAPGGDIKDRYYKHSY